MSFRFAFIAASFALLTSPTLAQQSDLGAVQSRNVVTSKAEALAVLSATPFIEPSYSQGIDMRSTFSDKWYQQNIKPGKKRGKWSSRLDYKDDGRVCLNAVDVCFRVEKAQSGFYMLHMKDGDKVVQNSSTLVRYKKLTPTQ